MKAERKCAALARRVAVCKNSITGEAGPSATADCEAQRQRWHSLCEGVALHESREPDTARRTQAVTSAYRAAAAARTDEEPQSGAAVRWLAERLVRCDADALGVRVAYAVGEHPGASIVAIVGSLLGAAALGRARALPSSAGPHLSGAQKLMQARVYLQGLVVATVVGISGLAEVVKCSRRLEAVAAENREGG